MVQVNSKVFVENIFLPVVTHENDRFQLKPVVFNCC